MKMIFKVKYIIYKITGGTDAFRRFSSNELLKYINKNKLDRILREELNKKKWL